MSWLLEIFEGSFGAIFDLARGESLRDKSEPRWLYNIVVIGYYVLFPALFVAFVLLSWKVGLVLSGVFIASLIAGAVVLQEPTD
jgi:hypothetical protein